MKKIVMIILVTLMIAIGCTDNQRARNYGGTETVKLMPNEEFVNISWKQDNLWVIVRNTETGQVYAREKSSYGVMQGKIIIE